MADYSGNDANVISINPNMFPHEQEKKITKTIVHELNAPYSAFATLRPSLDVGDLREFISVLAREGVENDAEVALTNGNLRVTERK